MGHDQFAGNVLEIMLSWFRALMSGVWSLFTGSSGGSLLSWLSGSWKSLLVILLTIGVVMDVIVYLLRWRPFWWWFRKKRMVVDDAILEPNAPLPSSRRQAPARRVQPSTRIPRRDSDVQRERDDAGKDDLFMEPSLFDAKPARPSAAKPEERKAPDLFMDDSLFDVKPAKPKSRGASSPLYAPAARGGRSTKSAPRIFDDDD